MEKGKEGRNVREREKSALRLQISDKKIEERKRKVRGDRGCVLWAALTWSGISSLSLSLSRPTVVVPVFMAGTEE
jgi:hypothetical protein